jgi:hypothetical protein
MAIEIIRVIGSGSGTKIKTSDNEYQIYCNSSVIRAEADSKSHDCLFLSDGILQTDEELKKLSNATGMNAIESFNIRRAKRITMDKRHARQLLIVSDRDKKDLNHRIKNIGLSYDRLNTLNSHNRSVLLFRYLGVSVIPAILKFGIKPTVFYLISLLLSTRFRPPVSVRPSTGMVAYLWAALNMTDGKVKIKLDGIGNSIEAHYPSLNDLQNEKCVYNQVHQIDAILYEKYRRM